MKQNDAVFAAACEVLGQTSFNEAVKPTTEQRKQIVEIVTQGIWNQQVDFSTEAWAKHDTIEKVRSYTVGMVSNHLRKDKRLNGNVKYEIKDPGSRANQGDATLKNLKALLSKVTDQEHKDAINEAIAKREAEIKAEKTKEVKIDANQIPEELRHLIPA